jgi:hypothetical protein
MARDAIARQYDVDKNRVNLVCETDKGSYRPGKITFFPKAGKSLDLKKIRESITATRLSGGTNMSVDYLEITASGQVMLDANDARFIVAHSNEQFVLKEASSKDGAKSALQRLRAAAASGEKVMTVTGFVDGWSGRFPVVLQALAKRPPEAPMVLVVTGFETSPK